VLFIHGIGIGLYPYVKFLEDINKFDPQAGDDGEIGIIAIELMPVSFRITSPILHSKELARQINIILDRHGFDKVVLASHSYGSVVSTHLLQDPTTAAKIGPILFVDPVTFLLHLPDIAYNFTARFNAHTGTFTRPDGRDPTHLSEYERMKRMSSVYFNMEQWEQEVAQRKEREDEDAANGKKRKRPSKKDLERFKEQKRLKKIAKTAWLRT